jgi:hypothetical protein
MRTKARKSELRIEDAMAEIEREIEEMWRERREEERARLQKSAELTARPLILPGDDWLTIAGYHS